MLAERNRAFERLFNIVLAVLLVGSLALTLYATLAVVAHPPLARRCRARDRRAGPRARAARELRRGRRDRRPVAQLRERARAAVRVRELPGEDGEPAVARVAHADRGGAQLARQPQGGAVAGRRARLHRRARRRASTASRAILDADDRGRAARAEPRPTSSASASTCVAVVAGCVDGLSARVSGRATSRFAAARRSRDRRRRARSRRADARQAGRERSRVRGRRRDRRPARRDDGDVAELSVANDGPPLPAGMEERLFESMVSVRAGRRRRRTAPGARALHRAGDRAVPRRRAPRIAPTATGVVITVTLPRSYEPPVHASPRAAEGHGDYGTASCATAARRSAPRA